MAAAAGAEAAAPAVAPDEEELVSQGAAHLKRHFRKHCDAEERLSFDAFLAMAAELDLPICATSRPEQESTFRSMCSLFDDTVQFDEYYEWVQTSEDPTALLLRKHCRIQQKDASIAAALTRPLTNLLRPLSLGLAPALLVLKIKCKHACLMLAKKAVLVIKAKSKNPTQFFRRNALNPFAQLGTPSASNLTNLKSEVKQRGARDVLRQLSGPYLANSMVAMAMFQSYTVACERLRSRRAQEMLAAGHPMSCLWATPLRIEAVSGLIAGVTQATLSTPLYNLRLRLRSLRAFPEEKLGVRSGLLRLYQTKGILALYANAPFVFLQEGCSLAAYFASYEFFRERLVRLMREEVNPSGKFDSLAWGASAAGAGVVLTGVGLPFENALKWHVSTSSGEAPRGVVRHMARKMPSRKAYGSILFQGMKRRLPLAPLAGLPLLVYEAMMHSGWVPNVHAVHFNHELH